MGSRMNIITILTLLAAAALAVVSWSGAFVPGTYARETASLAAQGAGQDLFDLFAVTPLLLISLWFTRRGSRTAFLIFGGTVFYVLYSFFIYAFGIHFNDLFLLYCLTLGASLYTFLLLMGEAGGRQVPQWFAENVPRRSTGVYFIVVALMFYFLWLSDVVPAILTHTLPAGVSDYNLTTNPVHVLDMALVLPGLLAIAVLLMRRRAAGFIMTPVFLVFIILLALALAAMVLSVRLQGLSEDASVAVIFAVLAVISGTLLTLFLRRMKPQPAKAERTS